MLTLIKGHNAITNVRKITYSNHNLDLVIIDAYAKFGNILSICSQDNEQKLNYDRRNDGWNDGKLNSCFAPLFQMGL